MKRKATDFTTYNRAQANWDRHQKRLRIVNCPQCGEETWRRLDIPSDAPQPPCWPCRQGNGERRGD